MDVFLQKKLFLSSETRQKVSILVLVDVFLQADGSFGKHGKVLVSILVLVDVFLQVSVWWHEGICPDSFNPCFSGCLSPDGERIGCTAEHKWVSILVLVDVFLQ